MEVRFLKIMAASIVLAGPLSASVVNYNPSPTTDTGWNSCGVFFYASLAGDSCRTTAFFEPDSLTTEFRNPPPGPISVVFQAGFDAWNNRDNVSYNPPGVQKGWTLGFGGDPGGAFDVSVAQAQQFDQNRNPINNNVITGGVTIQVAPNAALRNALATAAANAAGSCAINRSFLHTLCNKRMFSARLKRRLFAPPAGSISSAGPPLLQRSGDDVLPCSYPAAKLKLLDHRASWAVRFGD